MRGASARPRRRREARRIHRERARSRERTVDRLLDARDRLLEARETKLADRLLVAAGPVDPELRAYVALAKAGAPRRPRGPGKLGAVAPEVLADLEAAGSARAAWLAVDLALSRRARRARTELLEKARAKHGQAPERESLERVALLALDPTGYATLLARLAEPATELAARG